VPSTCSVLLAASDLLPPLTARLADSETELLTFSDKEALRALEVIAERKPKFVWLERQFAATPRGAALVKRIMADPSLSACEVRMVSNDRDDAAAPRKTPTPAGPPTAAPSSAAQALDRRGTRRAPRFRIAGSVTVTIEGNPATLVDLSTIGAQVISPTILKPNQRVRVLFAETEGGMKIASAVAWAAFEIPKGTGPRYRAGLEFTNADAAAVEAVITRHTAE
jgi:hypothetical protein